MDLASRTNMNPESVTMLMLMRKADDWLMFMSTALLVDTQQTGPLGDDKLYSPNWGMFGASHDFEGDFHVPADAQSRVGNRHGPPLSRVVLNRRNRPWQAIGKLAISP
jgi:hypothetical protein